MERQDLSTENWLELYRFLLQRLDGFGYVDVRREIETAAAAPLFEEGTAEQEEMIRKEFGAEVGKRSVRRRDPFEVFSAALDVIWTRMVEFPEIVSAIHKNLGDSGSKKVEFRVDYEEEYAPQQSEPLALQRLLLENEGKEKVRIAFAEFGISSERLVRM